MAKLAGREHLLDLAQKLLAGAAKVETIAAADYLLEPAASTAVELARWDLPAEQIEVAISRPEFQPPFEWVVEITVRHAAPEHLEHYLITATEVVSAKRRDLTPLTPAQMSSLAMRLERLLPDL